MNKEKQTEKKKLLEFLTRAYFMLLAGCILGLALLYSSYQAGVDTTNNYNLNVPGNNSTDIPINQKQMIVDEMTYYVNNKEEFQDNLIVMVIKENKK